MLVPYILHSLPSSQVSSFCYHKARDLLVGGKRNDVIIIKTCYSPLPYVVLRHRASEVVSLGDTFQEPFTSHQSPNKSLLASPETNLSREYHIHEGCSLVTGALNNTVFISFSPSCPQTGWNRSARPVEWSMYVETL